MIQLKPNLKFTKKGNVFLSPLNLQTLTLLYQPIVGAKSFSLYMTLVNLPAATDYKHHLLLQMLHTDMNELMLLRHQLEAIGLVEVYEKEMIFNYVVKSPLSAEQFFNDGIMRAFLFVKVGAIDFAYLKQLLIVDQGDAELGDRATKKFNDVFDVRVLSHVMPDDSISPSGFDAKSQGPELAQILDLSMLQTILKKTGISQEILSEPLIKTLNELAFLYKFDVHELARLVFDALDSVGEVNIPLMKQLARKQFQLMSKGEHVQVTLKLDEAPPRKLEQGDEKEAIVSFLSQSPIEFLQFKSGGKPPVPADMKLVEWLHIDQGMPAGVVNVLIDYVLNYTDGSLPKQLVEKIAGEWQRKGINTTEAAMKKVTTVLMKSRDYKKEKQKPIAVKSHRKQATRVEPIPDWFGQHTEKEEMIEDSEQLKRIEEMKQSLTGGQVNA